MDYSLSPVEARVIGALIEKEMTTPDNYPLSLNSLTLACNQKSNREPVLELSEAEVLDTVEQLISRHFVSDTGSGNSRVTKYAHRFCNTEFGDLQLTAQEVGVVCCLLLRGAQTPGELRTRTNRLCTFTDVRETEQVLDQLVVKQWVRKLPREAGKRESRYVSLFCEAESNLETSVPVSDSTALDTDVRIGQLEDEVAHLRAEIEALKDKINAM